MRVRSFLFGVVTGAAAGWLAEFYLLRDRLSAEAAQLRTQLHAAERRAGDIQRRLEASTAEAGDLRTRLVALQAELDGLRTQFRSAVVAPPNDLKQITGIGPRIEAVLQAAGIADFGRLAAATPDELRALLDAAGVTRLADPATWPEQAARLLRDSAPDA